MSEKEYFLASTLTYRTKELSERNLCLYPLLTFLYSLAVSLNGLRVL